MMKKILIVFILTSIKRCWTSKSKIEEEAPTTKKHERLLEDNNILGTPFNLTATDITASSISLSWAMNSSYDQIRGYIVIYRNKKQITYKGIDGSNPAHKLTGLRPKARYEVWIEPRGVVYNNDHKKASEKIIVTTDTAGPSAPTITNVTCYGTQKIYVEWKKPSIYYKNVDYYYIYYKTESSHEEYVHIQAKPGSVQRFLLDAKYVDFKGNTISLVEKGNKFCVRISVGKKNTAVYKGEFSNEMCVDMHEIGCIPSASAKSKIQISLALIVIVSLSALNMFMRRD